MLFTPQHYSLLTSPPRTERPDGIPRGNRPRKKPARKSVSNKAPRFNNRHGSVKTEPVTPVKQLTAVRKTRSKKPVYDEGSMDDEDEAGENDDSSGTYSSETVRNVAPYAPMIAPMDVEHDGSAPLITR